MGFVVAALARSLPSRRRPGNAGAVYVEFLVAFLPFFIFFLCLWQFSILSTTKLMVDHAAVCAARSAAVIMAEPAKFVDPTNPAAPGYDMVSPQRTTYVTTAAELALAPLILDGTVTTVSVAFPNVNADGTFTPMYPESPPTTMMDVVVTATMQCQIALANVILCSGAKTKQVLAEAIFPFQGATYVYQNFQNQP